MKCFPRRTFPDSTLFMHNSEESMMLIYNHKIDVVKFICSIFVVLIHLTVFLPNTGIATLENYYIYRYFFNIAVPFYFVSAGYLLSFRPEIPYLKKYSLRIFTMYIYFSIVYIFLNIGISVYDKFVVGRTFWDKIQNILSKITLNNILKGGFGDYHLWYLIALALAVLYLIVLLKLKLSGTTIFLISTLIYITELLNLVDFSRITDPNGLIKGMFYLSLGYFIGESNLVIKYPLLKFCLLIVLYVLNSIYSVTRIGEVFLALSTFYLMCYCKNNPGEETVLSKLGQHSLKIYIMHVFVYQMYYKILDLFGITSYRDGISDIILATIVCVVFSIILFKPVDKLLQLINKRIDSLIST